MKLLSALTLIPALAVGKILLAVGPSQPLTVGDKYEVEWLVDSDMILELHLVKQNSNGWEDVKTLFSSVRSKPCNGSYTWHIDETTPTGSGYGLWLNGQDIPDPSTGYADLSEWFQIEAKELR